MLVAIIICDDCFTKIGNTLANQIVKVKKLKNRVLRTESESLSVNKKFKFHDASSNKIRNDIHYNI